MSILIKGGANMKDSLNKKETPVLCPKKIGGIFAFLSGIVLLLTFIY
jgi:hypothetical protein